MQWAGMTCKVVIPEFPCTCWVQNVYDGEPWPCSQGNQQEKRRRALDMRQVRTTPQGPCPSDIKHGLLKSIVHTHEEAAMKSLDFVLKLTERIDIG